MMLLGNLLSLALTLFSFARCVRGDIFDDVIAALTNATDCASCHAVVLPVFQTLAHLGNDAFTGTITDVCQALNLADDDVCAGEMQRSGLILAHSLRQFTIGGTTATKFCDAVFGLCQPPPVTPFTVPFPRAAPTNSTRIVSKGRTPFQVVHLSDVHIDREYTVGSNANCTKPICCRDFADGSGTSATSDQAGPFGNSKCDSPSTLAASLVQAVEDIGANAMFSIFTGDVVEGATWLVNQSEVSNDLEEWNTQMLQGIRLPIFPSIGNHDSVPVNSFPRNITNTTLDPQFVFDVQSSGWKVWINDTAAAEVHDMSGSYSVRVPGTNLRIISVNTQYWYKQNFWLYDTDEQIADPNGLFAFMVQQLQIAEDSSERAWIIGHIPSGKADTAHDQSNYYDQIVQRYKDTIAAQFFGHSHKDQFEIAYSDWDNRNAQTADSILFIGPALTPTSGNPAFKLYDIDPDTYEVMDMKVFMTNISSPTFQENPTWELYYSARASYGPLVGSLGPTDSLNASFWHVLTDVFTANDTAFQLWNTRQSRGGAVSACTGTCKTTAICDMQSARSENNCDVSTPGLQFRRSEETLQRSFESDECEGGGIGSMMKRFLAGRQVTRRSTT
ncbi:sphingomyelin phosphodiesterase [Dentipellis sp. KUC8613]|nr:sphingomyelin phosphodiesterase [Dentipellis sp. KUC8613]